MKKLAMVRLERGIDVNGQSSVTELTDTMGLVLETDGQCLVITEYACVHVLPFSRVIDTIEAPPVPETPFAKAVERLSEKPNAAKKGK